MNLPLTSSGFAFQMNNLDLVSTVNDIFDSCFASLSFSSKLLSTVFFSNPKRAVIAAFSNFSVRRLSLRGKMFTRLKSENGRF